MEIKTKYGELTDCTELQAVNALYPIWKAAALWCGVEEEKISCVEKEMKNVSRTIYQHDAIPCLEVRTRILSDAIEGGQIDVYREYGGSEPPKEHIAPDRRHIKGGDLRKWISTHYPNDKPSFLFTATERSLNTGIKNDDYLVVTAERDNLLKSLACARKEFKEMKEKIAKLESDALKQEPIDTRVRNSYLKFIRTLCQIKNIDLSVRGKAKFIADRSELYEQKISEKKVKEIIDELLE